VTKTVTNGYERPWSPASDDLLFAVVVGTGVRGAQAAEILRGQGWEVSVHDSTGEVVLDGDARPALVVMVESSLVAGVRSMEPMGPPTEHPPTVVICESIRPGEIRMALSAGVLGVVLASALDSALVPCVTSVCVGQVCVPKSQARQVEAASLSARERQILGLVVMGYMNSEIAVQLTVAESTVKSHLSSAFTKLGVRSRHEAVDLILDSERGLGMGILGLGGEPIEGVGSSSG
jgi:DNA-binding NarL/FixJ family response regulator